MAHDTHAAHSPAVFITGEPKLVVPHLMGDGYSFEHCMFSRAMLAEGKKVERSLEMSKENPLLHEARVDTAIAEELKEVKREEFVEEKRRQQLRNNNQELRELSEHLKLAAISKDLSEHIGDFFKTRLQIEKSKAESQKQAELERLKFLDHVNKEQLKLKEQQIKLHDSLAAQMEQKQQRRKQESLQTLADRESRIAMQRQVEKEDSAKLALQERVKIQKLQEMDKYIEERKAHRVLQYKEAEADLKKNLDTQNQMDDRKKKLDQERIEIRRKQEEISQLLGQQVAKLETDKRQKDNLLLDLLESEHNAKEEARVRQQQQQIAFERMRAKGELEAYRLQVQQRNMDQEEQKRLEVVARKDVSADNQEAIDRQQKLNDFQKRKDYGKMLLSMIEDNQRKRAQTLAEDAEFFNMKAKEDKELRERVHQERIVMLNAVPPAVLRYLPKHVLSDEDRARFDIPKVEKSGNRDAPLAPTKF
ncbi:uncharacterized protein Dwil_GK20748 [Drosophila willistoni]|uniref:Meiosis-specific nuclear structural protein 1 n=1 Tax=Drosophila willistoni TaxID=7260 RepID=B4MJU4_DROWI|nr:trichohyalin [Drosophila willistoni]EDW72383.1 uncharacterized protein Dwil_GK20748 [Drosophila willistoni]